MPYKPNDYDDIGRSPLSGSTTGRISSKSPNLLDNIPKKEAKIAKSPDFFDKLTEIEQKSTEKERYEWKKRHFSYLYGAQLTEEADSIRKQESDKIIERLRGIRSSEYSPMSYAPAKPRKLNPNAIFKKRKRTKQLDIFDKIIDEYEAQIVEGED